MRGPIDLRSDETDLILNPRLPKETADRLAATAATLPALRAHVWLATSGSGEDPKLVAISKRALLVSAAAVNTHLESDANDVWMHALPLSHVAGIGILARTHLSGARWVGTHDAGGLPPRWSARAFVDAAEKNRATLSALVPTQLRDLVREGLSPPPALRAIIIGGDAIPPALHASARAAGWPILPSYGATETSSQVATASLASLATDTEPCLQVLSHATLRANDDGVLVVRSEALLTGYGIRRQDGTATLVDPKHDGWWTTADRGRVTDDTPPNRGQTVVVEGRTDDAVNVGGELVSLITLTSTLDALALDPRHAPNGDRAVIALPDDRLGHAIHLVVDHPDEADRTLRAFNERVAPFARAKSAHVVDRIPRTALGKLRRTELRRMLEREKKPD